MKTLISALIGLLCFLPTEIYTQTWDYIYGSSSRSSYDQGLSITVDNNGYVYVAGQTKTNYLVVKLNISGSQQWTNTFNGSGNGDDYAKQIVVDGSGNVFVTGSSYSSNGGWDVVTIKYNSSGSQQWAATYNSNANFNDVGNSLVVDGSGNVYVTGTANDINGQFEDVMTLKYNSSGSLQWAVRYNGPGDYHDEAYSICLDNSSNIYVSGRVFEGVNNNTGMDALIIKYNPSGAQQWIATWDAGSFGDTAYGEIITSMVISDSNDIYITGCSAKGVTGTSIFEYNYLTQKYNSSGTLQWTAQYNGPAANSLNYANDIALSTDGYVYITGSSENSSGNLDYATVKYSSNGTEQWIARYDGPGNGDDDAKAIAVDDGGCIFVTGGSLGSGTNIDYATIKYSPSGSQSSVDRHNGSSSDYDISNDIAVYSSSSLEVNYYFVTGREKNIDEDCTTLGYTYLGCSDDGDIVSFNKAPSSNSLMQNYPNPFNPVTQISFNVGSNGFVILKIYDLLGREIKTLVQEMLASGSYSANWDASFFPSGIYVYELRTGEFVETKRMVLVK